MNTTRCLALLLTPAALALAASPAMADTLGIRPLGGDWESGRTVGVGNWAIEGGGWAPSFAGLDASATADDAAVLSHWQQLPAWPTLRGIYGLGDGNEVTATLGPTISGGWRKFFLRAEAPWGGEYLQGLIQLGGGFNLASRLPMGYVRFPAIYERGAWTFHVAGGGYYLFNNAPMVDAMFGCEFSPLPDLQLGVHTLLRMDAKKITPMDGVWSFGGGARYRIGRRLVVQADLYQDAGPPSLDVTKPDPRIEFPHEAVSATVGYYF